MPALSVLCGESFPVTTSLRSLPTFCSIRFCVSDFMLSPLFYLDLSLCQVMSVDLFRFFCTQLSSLTRIIVEEAVFVPVSISDSIIKNQVSIGISIYV